MRSGIRKCSIKKNETFNTDYVKSVYKTAKGTMIVYDSPEENMLIRCLVPTEEANTGEILNAYTSACQNSNVYVSLNRTI